MNPNGLVLIVTRCDMIEYESENAASPAFPHWGVPETGLPRDSVEDQIGDFLDGRTHGEHLLHSLYDYILDEPVPERLLSLFNQ